MGTGGEDELDDIDEEEDEDGLEGEDPDEVNTHITCLRAVPGKIASGWNGNQLKIDGWGVFPGISIWTVP